MYTNISQWNRVREMFLKQKVSQRNISLEMGISRSTVAKMLKHKIPPGYRRRKPVRLSKLGGHVQYIKTLLHENELLPPPAKLTSKCIFEKLRDERDYEGCCSSVRGFILKNQSSRSNLWNDIYDLIISLSKSDAIKFLYFLSRTDPPLVSQLKATKFFKTHSKNTDKRKKPDKRMFARQRAYDWMHSVMQGAKTPEAITCDIGELESIEQILKQLYRGSLARRNMSLCVLAEAKGIPRTWIYTFLKIHKATGRKYLEAYKSGGVDVLYSRRRTVLKKADNEDTKKIIFSTLHEPPSLYGINRTTWKWDDLIPVLKQKGVVVGKEIIRQITKKAGFKWRKARIVLTSNDPEYREKLLRIQGILQNLQIDEAFFSIDEYGPFAVKMKGGRKLVGQGENYTVPQWQKSKGCLIMTAALELSTNQVTHFYSKKKNTDEMIRLMDVLIERYKGFKKLWLSWDAASWHMSKKLYEQIEAINMKASTAGGPIVKTAPLPAGAQFLNIIESVFSGLARGVIHNSNYMSADEAKAAIDRYFDERNNHFQINPKRAGKKIWGEERVSCEFHEANNCKDPRYR